MSEGPLRPGREGRRKAMDAIGCLLYVVAAAVMGGVLFSNCEKFFP